MKFKTFIRKYLSITILVLSALCAVVSLLIPATSFDAGGIAAQVSRRLEARMEKLDRFALRALDASQADESRLLLKSFPEDMVVYHYMADSLHCWYNRLPTMPSLENLSHEAVYQKYGRKWYVVRTLSRGEETVVEALLIRDENLVNVAKGQDGTSHFIRLQNKYNIRPLDASGASQAGNDAVVKLGGRPIFLVVKAKEFGPQNPTAAVYLRWIAFFLLLLSCLIHLSFNKNFNVCVGCVAVMSATAFVAQIWAQSLAETSQLFSPVLYAHDGLLNSFGSLLVFNLVIFLCYLAMFMCRDVLCGHFAGRKSSSVAYALSLALLFVASVAYLFYTLYTIVVNSGITMELFRINIVNGYTFLAYLSYTMLAVGILLLLETLVVAVNQIREGKITMMTRGRVILYSCIAAAAILFMISTLGAQKEVNRVTGWSNRLSVDRNLNVEMALRSVESQIASDQVLDVLCHSDNAEQLVMRRMEDHFSRIMSQCAFSVKVVNNFDSQLRLYMEKLVQDGVSVGPGSHFIYNRNATKGSYYTGVFPYYSEAQGLANLVVEVVPRSGANIMIPHTYSYAKYEHGRLSSFSGSFAYPTVIDGMQLQSRDGKNVFTHKGFRHFVNKINDDEVIIISRREERTFIYLITYAYMVFLLALVASIFRKRERSMHRSGSKFSRRMLTLVIASLSVTLVVMATVSVLFVYQRNERNMNNTLSTRISTIQLMLDDLCKQMNSSDALQSPQFMKLLDGISRSTSAPLDVYSPNGYLMVSNSAGPRRLFELNSLMSPKAYIAICQDHQRYFIEKQQGSFRDYYVLYAPVMNADGNMLAVVSSPYLQRDYDFTRDAVFHAATVVSLFIILLFVSVLIASSIVRSIFHPLVTMGKKMSNADAQNMEQIEYERDDEIAVLVDAYNTMVCDLQESTGKLAAAERDKAWSAMARQVAHEIKNPLTPIKLEIQRLQRLKSKNDPNWEEKFDSVSRVVLEHIDILSQTANEFSTFAKLYSEPAIEIDLDKTIKEQLLLFEDRGVDLTYLGTENAIIQGPKPQLIRVFVNLITNAIQAVEGSENPKIVVSLRKSTDEGAWDIVFEDNGPGVSEENQARLFTPNFTTKSSGTGLGLAICRSIVDRCGGAISYSRSFNLGGACFTVHLPALSQA